MTEALFGIPLDPTGFVPIHFSNIFDQFNFGPIGGNGLVPDASVDPMSAYMYMHHKADIIEAAAQQRPLVRLADKNLDIVGELTGELSMEYEELVADSGQAKYIIRFDNWMVDYIVNLTRIDEDLHLVFDPTPTQLSWRTRWGGKIHTINIQRHEDGTSTVELLALSNREHAKRLLFGANPIFSPEIQLPRMWILPGPIRSVLFASCFINLARLFVPGLSFLTNALNPASWMDPANSDSLFNINPLNWPIQVAFVDPVLDTSRWTVLGATWTDWHSATTDMLRDAGVIMRAYTCIPAEDLDSPYEELTDILDLVGLGALDSFVKPLRNAVVFRFEDWSGHRGPTGTAIDGLLNVIGVTLDDLFTTTLIDANTGLTLDGEPLFDSEGNNIPIFEALLGVAPRPPNVIWREGQFTALIDATHTLHKGSPRTVMTGGKSPSIVNQLQTFGIKYGLAQLSEMLNVAIGSFVNTAWEMPLTPGLDALYQGQLDNVLFAWERMTDPLRAIWNGDLSYQEFFARDSGTAYTLSGILTLRTALWKTRSFQGFKAKVRNGRPWTVDSDTHLGERNGFEFQQVIYVDQLMGIKRSVDRKKPLLIELTIGEDRSTFDPMGRVMRAVQGLYSIVGAFAGEGTIFG